MRNTLLKFKRHSLRCHDFLVHAYLPRMCTNVVDFRVLRRLCAAVANEIDNEIDKAWTNIPGIHDNGPRDHGVWRLTLKAYSTLCLQLFIFSTLLAFEQVLYMNTLFARSFWTEIIQLISNVIFIQYSWMHIWYLSKAGYHFIIVLMSASSIANIWNWQTFSYLFLQTNHSYFVCIISWCIAELKRRVARAAPPILRYPTEYTYTESPTVPPATQVPGKTITSARVVGEEEEHCPLLLLSPSHTNMF